MNDFKKILYESTGSDRRLAVSALWILIIIALMMTTNLKSLPLTIIWMAGSFCSYMMLETYWDRLSISDFQPSKETEISE